MECINPKKETGDKKPKQKDKERYRDRSLFRY